MTLNEAKQAFGRMPERIKGLWLKALRSGEYTQVCGRMRVTKRMDPTFRRKHGEGHCCLGVLTEIAKQEGQIHQFTINSQNQKLTGDVQHWAGLNNSHVTKLITLNDGTHDGTKPLAEQYFARNRKGNKNFREIADWIEENL